MEQKKNVLVLFGGQSSEHEISCLSAVNVVRSMDPEKYSVLLVGITVNGRWLYTDSVERISDGSWVNSEVRALLTPDADSKCLYLMRDGVLTERKIDAAFPVLHGLYGEDGTVQGIFTLARIPYVGCGVLASAAAMDKLFTKLVVEKLGIRQAAYTSLYRYELEDMSSAVGKVESALSYPVFVKPSCAGSSVGVTKAEDREALIKALIKAAREDSKILCEETIVGRELECAVLGTDREVRTSGVGEILSAAEFYDYDAKYHNSDSRTLTDPVLPEGVSEEIRLYAERIFRALDGFGLSRVDFFLDAEGVVFNEINTLPGFTGISMYPMLFERAGIPGKELISRLIDTAFLRDEH